MATPNVNGDTPQAALSFCTQARARFTQIWVVSKPAVERQSIILGFTLNYLVFLVCPPKF